MTTGFTAKQQKMAEVEGQLVVDVIARVNAEIIKGDEVDPKTITTRDKILFVSAVRSLGTVADVFEMTMQLAPDFEEVFSAMQRESDARVRLAGGL